MHAVGIKLKGFLSKDWVDGFLYGEHAGLRLE